MTVSQKAIFCFDYLFDYCLICLFDYFVVHVVRCRQVVSGCCSCSNFSVGDGCCCSNASTTAKLQLQMVALQFVTVVTSMLQLVALQL